MRLEIFKALTLYIVDYSCLYSDTDVCSAILSVSATNYLRQQLVSSAHELVHAHQYTALIHGMMKRVVVGDNL